MDLQSNWDFQAIVKQVQDGVFIVEDGVIIYANENLSKILGYPENEIIGYPFTKFVAESDKELLKTNHEKRFRGEDVLSEYHFRILKKDNTEKTVSLQVGFYSGKKNVIGTLKDISRIEETIHEIEQLKGTLEQIIRKLPDIYYRTDMQGRIVRLSPSVTDILGYQLEDGLGEPITKFYENAQDRSEIIHSILAAKGDVVRVEAPLLHKDGHKVWFTTNAYLVMDDDGNPVGIEGLARDDTARKKLEDRLQTQTDELVESRNYIVRMSEFTREINESTDMEHIVDRILKFATEEFGFEGGAIYLVNPDKSFLEFYRGHFPSTSHSIDFDKLKSIRIPLTGSEGIHARVFSRKRTLYLRRFRKYIRFAEDPVIHALKLKNLIIQPLTIRDECIGVMDFTRYSAPLKLSYQDREKISRFSDQIVSAIRNSRLIKEILSAKEIMEEEVSLARKFQYNMVPLKSPADFISTVYRPMMAVGGDFYEFIKFENSNDIGIFISDVSGHGIYAAFITAMLKTLLLQSEQKKTDPGELLSYLNDSIRQMTTDQFITAFYCIYNPDTRMLKYSNAGHNYPFSIEGEKIHEVTGGKSFPLGVLSSSELQTRGQHYHNAEMVLPSSSRLLIFTDGLLEVIPIQGGLTYEETRLNQVLLDNMSRNGEDLLKELVQDLHRYRGSGRFEDDICVVCMDIP